MNLITRLQLNARRFAERNELKQKEYDQLSDVEVALLREKMMRPSEEVSRRRREKRGNHYIYHHHSRNNDN